MTSRPDLDSRIRTILVATDFSANAASALDWALEVARRHGARITIVHAIEAIATASVPLDIQEELTRSLSLIEQIVSRSNVEVTSRHRPGKAWEVIIQAAAESDADLIVLGARGQTAYSRLFLGSTVDRVIRLAPTPVVTVHPDDERGKSQIRTVLAATDFSEEALLALKAALGLLGSAAEGGRLVLLHAWQPLVEYGFGEGEGQVVVNQLDDTEEQAQEALETLAEPLRGGAIEVETVVRHGYPARVIEKEAEAIGADLVALGTHGRSGLNRFMMGSIAERVLHHAPCPVLTVRHPEPAPRGADGSAGSEATQRVTSAP